jgi:hypothetical protein
MKELETLVEGFKTDQREIESAIVRTLHTLDDLEESAAGAAGAAAAAREKPTRHDAPARDSAPADPKPAAPAGAEANQPAGSELDIF